MTTNLIESARRSDDAPDHAVAGERSDARLVRGDAVPDRTPIPSGARLHTHWLAATLVGTQDHDQFTDHILIGSS